MSDGRYEAHEARAKGLAFACDCADGTHRQAQSVFDQCQEPPCPLKNPPKQDTAWRAEMRAHFASGAHSQTRRDAAAFVRMMEAEFRRATGREVR